MFFLFLDRSTDRQLLLRPSDLLTLGGYCQVFGKKERAKIIMSQSKRVLRVSKDEISILPMRNACSCQIGCERPSPCRRLLKSKSNSVPQGFSQLFDYPSGLLFPFGAGGTHISGVIPVNSITYVETRNTLFQRIVQVRVEPLIFANDVVRNRGRYRLRTPRP